MIATLFAMTVFMAGLDGDLAPCNAAIERHRALIEAGSRRLVDAPPPKNVQMHMRPGCAVVTFRIEADGSVRDAQAVEASPKSLGVDAVRGVRNWRFSPGIAEPAAAYIVFSIKRE